MGLSDLVLSRSTTAQQLADALFSSVLAGQFAPGDRLRESAIAAQLGISRNTVREAVRMLERSGLVRYEVYRGAVVISPTPDKVSALFAARERLETAAVSALTSPTQTQIAAVQDAYGHLASAAAGNLQQIVDLDLGFHSAIVALLGSSRIDEFYADLTLELRYYLGVLSVEDRVYENPDELLAEHEAILKPIMARDTDEAIKQVRQHLADSAARIQEILQDGGAK